MCVSCRLQGSVYGSRGLNRDPNAEETDGGGKPPESEHSKVEGICTKDPEDVTEEQRAGGRLGFHSWGGSEQGKGVEVMIKKGVAG